MRIVHRLRRSQRLLDEQFRLVVGGNEDIDTQAGRRFSPLVVLATREDEAAEKTADDAVQHRPRQKGEQPRIRETFGFKPPGNKVSKGGQTGTDQETNFPTLKIRQVVFLISSSADSSATQANGPLPQHPNQEQSARKNETTEKQEMNQSNDEKLGIHHA